MNDRKPKPRPRLRGTAARPAIRDEPPARPMIEDGAPEVVVVVALASAGAGPPRPPKRRTLR